MKKNFFLCLTDNLPIELGCPRPIKVVSDARERLILDPDLGTAVDRSTPHQETLQFIFILGDQVLWLSFGYIIYNDNVCYLSCMTLLNKSD